MLWGVLVNTKAQVLEALEIGPKGQNERAKKVAGRKALTGSNVRGIGRWMMYEELRASTP
jgi:hypothetical protein